MHSCHAAAEEADHRSRAVPALPLQVVDFYEYYEGLQEGWDGPALLVFSDGNKVGARLDRNGLRPARYWETSDGMVYVASEVGVLDDVMSNAHNVIRKGRLGPGQMVCADLDDVSGCQPCLHGFPFCQSACCGLPPPSARSAQAVACANLVMV